MIQALKGGSTAWVSSFVPCQLLVFLNSEPANVVLVFLSLGHEFVLVIGKQDFTDMLKSYLPFQCCICFSSLDYKFDTHRFFYLYKFHNKAMWE